MFKYVDRNYWVSKLSEYFPDKYVDNLTDFNYSKCFTMDIVLSPIKASAGSEEITEYLIKNLNLYRIVVEITAFAPLCIVKYSRHFNDKGEKGVEYSNTPFCKEHYIYERKIRQFISDFELTKLNDKILMTEVPEITLELKENPVSVYNCLFQDSYSYFPY